MNKKTALDILKKSFSNVNEEYIKSLNPYVEIEKGNSIVTLDGEFSSEELQAIAVWMEAE
ncbi:TPA: hypothetical protein I7256_20750 [Vibrio vulnificus]|uniref:hypothetical protein n=1 Tax=Vibrio vulnificus TaxID=672 RepID=UPI0019D4CD2A|nr:hypothetical protein [Vibrio vulnificus]MBN8114476.1 hypothetical protein [Vibrio vulnificus]HAS6410378.1 hypothetical protein [Vibrio vulnificus]HAS6414947.1 hypothetical protein [Vibrio vulnificus]HDY7661656.1 hypothetical protein [Vibrio vulnificus]